MNDSGPFRFAGILTLLILCAILLSARVIYLFLADSQRFPVNTVKIAASYQHITRKQIEAVLSDYINKSFMVFPVSKLKSGLIALDWVGDVQVNRIWPDTLKITLKEKVPVAIWNNLLMTAEGQLFNSGDEKIDMTLPRLNGPKQQQTDILQIYQKLSKLLSVYGLHAAALALHDNQAWELLLTNGIQLRLGKRDIETRLTRFCRAWPLIFSDKPEQLARVDLRYARGMAVQWKQQTGR